MRPEAFRSIDGGPCARSRGRTGHLRHTRTSHALECGTAYRPRGPRQRSLHSSLRTGELFTWRRETGHSTFRPGGMRNAECHNGPESAPHPVEWVTGKPDDWKQSCPVWGKADGKGPIVGTSPAADPTGFPCSKCSKNMALTSNWSMLMPRAKSPGARRTCRTVSGCKQHRQKALEQMNRKLTEVVSAMNGKTGMAILRAILAGERDPQRLARHRDPRCTHDQATIAKAFEGHWRAAHLFALRQALGSTRFFSSSCRRGSSRLRHVSRRV
jgi:hypothetical protein